MTRIAFQAIKPQEIEFLSHLFTTVPLAKSQAEALEPLEAKWNKAYAASLDIGDPEDALSVNQIVELMAEILDIRTTPAGGGKVSLGDRIREAWEADQAPVAALERFYLEVQGIDPFGESETDPEASDQS